MIDFLGSLNWLGGMTGAVIAFFVGAIWFAPKVFGGAWMAHQGKGPEDFGSPGPAMIISAIYHVVLAIFIMILHHFVPPSAFRVVVLVLMLSAALSMLQRCMYEGRPTGFWRIIAGHEVVIILVIAAAVGMIG
jgi:hypothetical protein